MKYLKGLLYGLIISLLLSTPAWALKTKSPVVISFSELEQAGVKNIANIRTDLNITNPKQNVVIRHVVTTGRDKATHEGVMLSIKTMESIKPRVDSFRILKNASQIPLTNAQVKSLIHLLKMNAVVDIPAWLTDMSQKKYINIALQKNNSSDTRAAVLTVADARALVTWAIGKGLLQKADHP